MTDIAHLSLMCQEIGPSFEGLVSIPPRRSLCAWNWSEFLSLNPSTLVYHTSCRMCFGILCLWLSDERGSLEICHLDLVFVLVKSRAAQGQEVRATRKRTRSYDPVNFFCQPEDRALFLSQHAHNLPPMPRRCQRTSSKESCIVTDVDFRAQPSGALRELCTITKAL